MSDRPRKTLEVETIKRLANIQLARKDVTTDQRKAIAGLLEALLFEANAYGGFNYVYWSCEGGYQEWVDAGRPEFPEKYCYIYGPESDGVDDYRRTYY